PRGSKPLRVRHLDGHVAAQVVVVALVDGAERAGAELPGDAIPPQLAGDAAGRASRDGRRGVGDGFFLAARAALGSHRPAEGGAVADGVGVGGHLDLDPTPGTDDLHGWTLRAGRRTDVPVIVATGREECQAFRRASGPA